MAPPARQTKSAEWALTTSAVFACAILYLPRTSVICSAKIVEPRRVLHQELLPHRRIGRDERHKIDEIAVIGHVAGDVGMGPIGAPEDAIGCGGDERVSKGNRVVEG